MYDLASGQHVPNPDVGVSEIEVCREDTRAVGSREGASINMTSL